MKKYRIEYKEGSAHGGLYELEQKHFFYVIENQTNRVVRKFEGEYFATYENGTWSHGYSTGVSKIELNDEETEVIVHHFGSDITERIKL